MSQSAPKKYVFVGKGVGVPGLPHEVTNQQAKDLGIYEILREAIKNGNYKEQRSKKEGE